LPAGVISIMLIIITIIILIHAGKHLYELGVIISANELTHFGNGDIMSVYACNKIINVMFYIPWMR